jgi:hypothetical protein
MTRVFRAARPFVLLVLLVLWVAPVIAQPAGTMTWGVHVTLATRWLDTSETVHPGVPGVGTPGGREAQEAVTGGNW